MRQRITHKLDRNTASSEQIPTCPECGRHQESSGDKRYHLPTCSHPRALLKTYLAAPDNPTNETMLKRMAARHGRYYVEDARKCWLERDA